MNGIVIGKRVPIGAAVNGCVVFGAHVWNITHEATQLDLGTVGLLAISLTAIAQILVANCLGVTNAKPDQG